MNRGLILVDWKIFEPSMILTEFWYGRYKTKLFQNMEKLFSKKELLNVCLFPDPNYPNHPNHPNYPNYPNHLGLFQTISHLSDILNKIWCAARHS